MVRAVVRCREGGKDASAVRLPDLWAAVALYESIVAGTKENRSLVGQLNGLESMPEPEKNKEYHWLTVANAAIANTIRGLYPAISQTSLEAINNLEQKFASQYQAQFPKQEYERSVAHAQAVADTLRADSFSIRQRRRLSVWGMYRADNSRKGEFQTR